MRAFADSMKVFISESVELASAYDVDAKTRSEEVGNKGDKAEAKLLNNMSTRIRSFVDKAVAQAGLQVVDGKVERAKMTEIGRDIKDVIKK